MTFILRRLVFYVVAAWVALTLNFFIPRAMPGNAVEAVMSKFPGVLQPAAYRAIEAMLRVGHAGLPGRHAGRRRLTRPLLRLLEEPEVALPQHRRLLREWMEVKG